MKANFKPVILKRLGEAWKRKEQSGKGRSSLVRDTDDEIDKMGAMLAALSGSTVVLSIDVPWQVLDGQPAS